MTLKDVLKLPLLQTRSIAEDCKTIETYTYIVNCCKRMMCGDYGKICQEDTNANNAELLEGEGKILARYEKRYELTEDIYIIAYFSQSMQGIDSNHVIVMYVTEY